MSKKPPEQNKQHLSNLLAAYKDRFKPPQASVERLVIETVKEVTGVELRPSQVIYTVSTKTIKLNTPSILRAELQASQNAIKQSLKQKLPEHNIPEVFI